MGQIEDFMNELDSALPNSKVGGPPESPVEPPVVSVSVSEGDKALLRKATGLSGPRPSQKRMTKAALDAQSDALFANIGATYEGVDRAMLEEKRAKLQDELAADIEKFRAEPMQAALTEAWDRTKAVDALPRAAWRGVDAGVNAAMSTAYNAFAEVANLMSNTSANRGAVQSGAIPLIDYQERLNGLPETEKFIAEVTQAFVPVVASATIPGGFAAKTVAGAVASYFTLDPKQKTLSDWAEGTAFEKAFLVGPIVQTLQKEDDDTFYEGRFKNVADYILPDAVAASIVSGVAKGFSGIRKAARFIGFGKEPKLLSQFPEIEAAVNAEMAEAKTTAKTAAPSSEVATAEANTTDAAITEQPTVATGPAEKEWASVTGVDTPPIYKAADGATKANPNNSTLVENMGRLLDENPSAFTPRDGLPEEAFLPRGKQTHESMAAAGAKLADDEAAMTELLQRPATQPVTAEERIALEITRSRVNTGVADKIKVAIETGNDLDIMAAKEAIDNAMKLSLKAQSVNSEAGRSLGVIRSLGLLSKTGDKEALEALGNIGRNKLKAEYITKYGKENLDAIIRAFDEIGKLPDSAFTTKFDEVARRTKYMRTTDSLYSIMINSYLTTKTVASVVGSNAAMTVAKVADNYVSAAIGGAIKSKGEATSVAEANAFALGLMRNFRESMSMAWEAMKEGRGAAIRADMAPLAVSSEAIAFNGTWDMISEKGIALLERGASSKLATFPSRLVMGGDAFYKHMINAAYLESQGVRHGLNNKLAGAELEAFVKNFIAKPSDEALRMGEDISRRVTMSRDMTDTFLGKPQKWLEKDPSGVARFFFPFMNTRANVIATSIEYSPAAAFTKEFQRAFRAGGRERDMAFAKIANGSTFALAIGGLVAEGVLELKKEDYRQEQTLFEEGKGRMSASLNLGGKSYPIGWVDPVARAMNLVAIAYPAMVSAESDMDRDIIAATLSMALSQLDDSAFGQLAQVGQLVEKTRAGEKFSAGQLNFLTSPAAAIAIPLSGTVKQLSTLWDPTKASRVMSDDEKTVLDYFFLKLQDTAGYGRPPQRNILGNVVTEPRGVQALGPFYSSDQKNSSLITSLKQLSDYEESLRRRGMEPILNIEMPTPAVDVKLGAQSLNISLTAEEYDEMIVDATSTLLPGPDGQALTLEQRLTDFMYGEGANMASLAVQGNKSLADKQAAYMKAVNGVTKIVNLYYGMAAERMSRTKDVQDRAKSKVDKQQALRGTPLDPFRRQ